jgi:hypothetical protein
VRRSFWIATVASGLTACASSMPPSGSTPTDTQEPERWSADVGAKLEGTWESTTTMSEHEGGACTLVVDEKHLVIDCSPGSRHASYRYAVTERSAELTTLEAISDGADATRVRLRVETLQSSLGRRALRIEDTEHPDVTPLRAYGRPDLWVAATP